MATITLGTLPARESVVGSSGVPSSKQPAALTLEQRVALLRQAFDGVADVGHLNELADEAERQVNAAMDRHGWVYRGASISLPEPAVPAAEAMPAAAAPVSHPVADVAKPRAASEYRRLQLRARQLGVRATGSKGDLRDRVVAATEGKSVASMAANEPAAPSAPAPRKRKKAAPAPKLKPRLVPLLMVHDAGGELRPATPDEIRAAYAALPKGPAKKAG